MEIPRAFERQKEWCCCGGDKETKTEDREDYVLSTPHNDTLGAPGLIGQIVDHLAIEYVYKNRCLYII